MMFDWIFNLIICQRLSTMSKWWLAASDWLISTQEFVNENVNSFHTMIMNFITDMFSAKNLYIEKTSDAILIIINKLIKHVIYISMIKDLNIKRLMNLLWWKFVSQHEMMQSIISNQDSLFINHFWITLCWYLEMKWKLSTAFHLQINDQTERQNQMLEHYLQVYFN